MLRRFRRAFRSFLAPRLASAFASGLALVVVLALAATPARAANQPPELLAALTDLSLAPGASASPIDLAPRFRDPEAPGSAARISVRLGTETRFIDLALLDAQAPQTVANFLAYVDAGRYAANFFHRSVPGFVVQNGGFFFVDDDTFDLVPTFAPVVNEPGVSNTRGTVAMAKVGPPQGQLPNEQSINSATSQWFINLADNSANLDAQNGGFTVFARVLGTGMQVADATAALGRYNLSNLHPAFGTFPLTEPLLDRSAFVETSISRIAPVSFSVSVDDPALVSATLQSGRLSLTAASDRGGSTTVRITATDLEGGSLQAGFTVTVPKIAQTLAVAPGTPGTSFLPGRHWLAQAEASSGLPVGFSIVSGPAVLAADTVNGIPRPYRIRFTGPGEVLVRFSQPGNALYQPAPEREFTFTVLPPTPTATLRLPVFLHDYDRGAPNIYAETEPPGLQVDFTFQLGSAPPSAVVPVNAGRYTVVATINDPGTLSRASARSTLTIRKAPLQVRARDALRRVGEPNPVFELEYTGFPGGVPEPIDLPPRAATRARASSPQGDYPILVSGGLDNNFTFVPAQPPGTLQVAGAGGSYEALIGPPEAPVGKLSLLVPPNALSFTGTLALASEPRLVPIKSTAPLSGPVDLSTASGAWTRPATATTPSLNLSLTIESALGINGRLRIGEGPEITFSGEARLPLHSEAGTPGPHTLVIQPPAPDAAPPAPGGFGYASGRIAPLHGRLSLAGRLADGTPFTASLLPDSSLGYLLWSAPYGTRAEAYLAGTLTSGSRLPLIWRKAALPPTARKPDAAYRAGFGPLAVSATLSPWQGTPLPGEPAATLAELHGLQHHETSGAAPFDLALLPPAGAAFTEDQLATLPPTLALSRAARPLLPATNPARLAFALDPRTGVFSGSFLLRDTLPAPTASNPAATRAVARKVSFAGVLGQHPADGAPAGFGHGHFLLPALPGAASPEQVSGEVRLLQPAAP